MQVLPPDLRPPAAAAHSDNASGGELSLGERKARHREEHLCLKCNHHLVCGMAKALDPNLLVTIAHCLGFEPVEPEGQAPVIGAS